MRNRHALRALPALLCSFVTSTIMAAPLDPPPPSSNPVAAASDTVRFGGDGFGNVVRDGTWDWETDSGAIPEFFVDGDPVGNSFSDGWTFTDLTTRGTISPLGAGHWRPDGTYDFDFDDGAFAHRASVHPNDGVNDGPDPLSGSWSLWIGTNLYLNPEHCGWQQTAGYGDAWSQGFVRELGGLPAGSVDMTFVHRYAVEAGFDTNWVETSLDGVAWEKATSFTGGTAAAPQPAPAGDTATVLLRPDFAGGTLWIRFRLVSDVLLSDETEGGHYLYGWQIDDVVVRVDGVPQTTSTFEDGIDGWQPSRFEGRDVLATTTLRPAGRIDHESALACSPSLPCATEDNVFFVADRDDCIPWSAQSGAWSPAFSIGGPENADIDGAPGHIWTGDVFVTEGSDGPSPSLRIAAAHYPAVDGACPYTPPAGAPGAGSTFGWSRLDFASIVGLAFPTGPGCWERLSIELTEAAVPTTADSVLLYVWTSSGCSFVGCEPGEASTVLIDNMQFLVYGATTGVGDAPAAPAAAPVLTVRPNPANPLVHVRYGVPVTGHVSLQVFDIAGRHVRTLVEGTVPARDTAYETTWDGRNADGTVSGSGVYLIRLDTPERSTTKKVVLVQ